MGRFILGIIIGVLVIIFMFQNVEPLTVSFIAWTVTLSRAVVLLIVFAVGIIVGSSAEPPEDAAQRPGTRDRGDRGSARRSSVAGRWSPEIYYDRGVSLKHPEFKKWYLTRRL